MISTVRHAAALLMSGGALALTGGVLLPSSAGALPSAGADPSAGVPPARVASQGWRVAKTLSVPGQSVLAAAIAAVGPADAWVLSVIDDGGSKERPLLEHWNGRAWSPVALPARAAARFGGQNIIGFIGASSRNVWLFNFEGGYLHRRGSRWTSGTVPGARKATTIFLQADAFGPADIWVFGERTVGPVARLDFRPVAVRFNGSKWTPVPVPGTGTLDVTAVSATDMWAVTGTELPASGIPASPRILHWNGTSWRVAVAQPRLPRYSTVTGILAESKADVWIGGSAGNGKGGTSELAQRWDGTSWTADNPPARPSAADFYLDNLVPDGGGGFWAYGSTFGWSAPARLWHYAGGAWSAPVTVRSRWLLIGLAGVPHGRSVWGIADAGPGLNKGLILLHGAAPR